MIRVLKRIGSFIGSGARAFVALIGIAGITIASANYFMTVPGSGTSFGSIVVGGVHYAQQFVCDFVTPGQCANVDTHGQQLIDVNTTNNNLYAAAIAPVPCKAAATWNASTGLTGTNPVGCDGSAALWGDVGAWAGTAVGAPSNFGTSPGAVGAPGVNSSQFQGTTAVVAEPCQTQTKTFTPINVSASGTVTTPIAAGTAAKKTYICQIILSNNAADNVAVVEATTATSCGTVTAGIWGGTTASAGFNFPANGGVSLGSGGYYVGKTATNNDDVCLITSAATQLTGGILWVQQ